MITYAASLGGHNTLTPSEWDKVGSYLKNFDKISVREKQLLMDLKRHCGIKSDIVVDPTILANTEIFEQIATRPKDIPDKYVLVFSLAPTDNLMEFSEHIANQINCDIVCLTAVRTPIVLRKRRKHTIEVSPTIEEFLGLFKYAKCIVTVSFHGTVFSVLFRKDFYSLTNYMQDRAQQFLEGIGLDDRLVSTSKDNIIDFYVKSINYNKIDDKLRRLKYSSLEYIQSSLYVSTK